MLVNSRCLMLKSYKIPCFDDQFTIFLFQSASSLLNYPFIIGLAHYFDHGGCDHISQLIKIHFLLNQYLFLGKFSMCLGKITCFSWQNHHVSW